MGKFSLEAKLERARIAIEGALNHPGALNKLANYGYDAKKLYEGKALCEQINMLCHIQNEGQGEQKGVSSDFAQACQEINTLYRYHLNIAKISLQNDRNLWDVLQLQGPRNKSIPGWLSQVKAFYYNIHRVTTQMKQRGVTEEELMQVKTMIEAAICIRKAFNKAEREATTENTQALEKKLDAWMNDYFSTAKSTLKDNKQQMEALGIVVAS